MGKAAKFLYLLSGRSVPLLDEYSGAAAAYSLRSLTASSTTNVVKVRRSGDDAELDFTADKVSDGTLAAWVVAGGGTENGLVTTWYDQSGNANNAIQATAANQPKIVSSGTLVTENGKAALDFDGTDDFLSKSTSITNVSAVSGFAVNKLNQSPSTLFRRLLLLHETGSDYQTGFYLGSISNSDEGLTLFRHASPFNTKGGDITSQNLLTGIAVSGSDETLYQNGTEIASNSAGSGSMSSVVIKIGSNYNASDEYWIGTIQEVVFYTIDQSANRTGIEANINAHYNIYS